ATTLAGQPAGVHTPPAASTQAYIASADEVIRALATCGASLAGATWHVRVGAEPDPAIAAASGVVGGTHPARVTEAIVAAGVKIAGLRAWVAERRAIHERVERLLSLDAS